MPDRYCVGDSISDGTTAGAGSLELLSDDGTTMTYRHVQTVVDPMHPVVGTFTVGRPQQSVSAGMPQALYLSDGLATSPVVL